MHFKTRIRQRRSQWLRGKVEWTRLVWQFICYNIHVYWIYWDQANLSEYLLLFNFRKKQGGNIQNPVKNFRIYRITREGRNIQKGGYSERSFWWYQKWRSSIFNIFSKLNWSSNLWIKIKIIVCSLKMLINVKKYLIGSGTRAGTGPESGTENDQASNCSSEPIRDESATSLSNFLKPSSRTGPRKD